MKKLIGLILILTAIPSFAFMSANEAKTTATMYAQTTSKAQLRQLLNQIDDSIRVSANLGLYSAYVHTNGFNDSVILKAGEIVAQQGYVTSARSDGITVSWEQ